MEGLTAHLSHIQLNMYWTDSCDHLLKVTTFLFLTSHKQPLDRQWRRNWIKRFCNTIMFLGSKRDFSQWEVSHFVLKLTFHIGTLGKSLQSPYSNHRQKIWLNNGLSSSKWLPRLEILGGHLSEVQLYFVCLQDCISVLFSCRDHTYSWHWLWSHRHHHCVNGSRPSSSQRVKDS